MIVNYASSSVVYTTISSVPSHRKSLGYVARGVIYKHNKLIVRAIVAKAVNYDHNMFIVLDITNNCLKCY